MKTLITRNVTISRVYKSSIFIILITAIFSCKKDSPKIEGPFLQGYWTYLNGAEAYYDGTSYSAIGTKVPTYNIGFDFVVGENYWQDLRQKTDSTWVLNHIVRLNIGTKTYNPTTFKKINSNTIVANISGYGRDTLTKRP